jgi:tetratricopeptide (TPR) repeat protein
MYEEALALYREKDDPHYVTAALENIGTVALLRGRLDVAIQSLDEAVRYSRSLRETRSTASSGRWLARALVGARDFDRARDLLEESLAFAEELGHRQGTAATLEFTAAYAAAAGAADAGARLLGAAETAWEASGAARLPDIVLVMADVEQEIRDAVGEEAYAAEVAAGRALSREEAVALVRDALDAPITATNPQN